MKYLVVAVSVLTVLVNSKTVTTKDVVDLETNTAYGYLSKIGLQLAKKIRESESLDTTIRNTGQAKDRVKRIVDGNAAYLGDIPYQAGIIIEYVDGESACGGSLLNSKRVLTAGHCWWDGEDQAQNLTVVLGSVKLYKGGTRLETSKVVLHKDYDPWQQLNDVAIIYLPRAVRFSSYIKPIALPSGSELKEDFAGHTAIASGFGWTTDDDVMTIGSHLSYVRLKVITNFQCSNDLDFVTRTNICTKGLKHKNVCKGDSGGPLAIKMNNTRILIGVTSFGSPSGCENSMPAAFVRITPYVSFINSHLKVYEPFNHREVSLI